MLFVFATAIACAALVASERAGVRSGVWLTKPFASTMVLALALSLGAWGSEYGRLLCVALAFSWLGDVLLIPRGDSPFFLAGMVSFFLAHLGYCAAFWRLGLHPRAAGVSFLAMAIVDLLVYRWLRPRLSGLFRFAVPAYLAAIALMVVFAVSASVAMGRPRMGLGAALFAASDLAVARDRFVADSWRNKAVGLPLYYTAQLILASTAAC
jgi:uncharacterized membrane protein YhhN